MVNLDSPDPNPVIFRIPLLLHPNAIVSESWMAWGGHLIAGCTQGAYLRVKTQSSMSPRVFYGGSMRLRAFPSALVFFVTLAVAVAGGCSSLVQPDRVQCSTNDDCTRRGGAFANSICAKHLCEDSGPWSCLGQVSWPTSTAGTVTATLTTTDLVTGQPISGVPGRACRKLDTTCADPVLTGLVSDATGRIIVTVPQGFDGYLELTATGAMRGSYFFYPPLTSDREIPSVPVLQMSALTTFAALVGVNLMAERGHLLVGARSCLGQPAEGLSFSSVEGDAATAAFYMIKSIPSTKQPATDTSGWGGLLNLPPGSVTLTGRLATTGQTIGTLSVLARAGELTYTALVPAPQ